MSNSCTINSIVVMPNAAGAQEDLDIRHLLNDVDSYLYYSGQVDGLAALDELRRRSLINEAAQAILRTRFLATNSRIFAHNPLLTKVANPKLKRLDRRPILQDRNLTWSSSFAALKELHGRDGATVANTSAATTRLWIKLSFPWIAPRSC